jgi:hypothetical protein
MPWLPVSFHDFGFSDAEMIRSLVVETPEVSKSEMTTNTNYPHAALFFTTLGFRILELHDPCCKASSPWNLRYPKYQNAPFLLRLLSRCLDCCHVSFAWTIPIFFGLRDFATPMTLILYSFESSISEIPVDSPISSTCPPTDG